MSGELDPEVVLRHQAARVHGRYLLRRSEDGRGLLVGFHGYGEDAAAHLRELLSLPGQERWHLAAVQALHPFYNRRSGGVVAGWMTRQDRELAIRDNIDYVRSVVDTLREELGAGGPLVYCGFSQGTAMAYRAAAGAGHAASGVVALCGDVPPEVAEVPGGGFPPVLIGRGDADTWYDGERMEADLRRLSTLGAPVETCVFAGDHSWTDPFRAAAGTFLDARLGHPGTSG